MRDVGKSKAERGAALLVVTVVLIIMLAAGLAGVALTSGELAGAAGVRVRSATDNCALAALEHLRTMLPNDIPATFDETERELPVGSATLTFRAGHYDGNDAGEATIEELDPGTFDATSLYQGMNITNTMGTVGGSSAGGVRLYKVTARCEGPGGFGAREAQLIFRYGQTL